MISLSPVSFFSNVPQRTASPGYWDSGPSGYIESGDATLQEAIRCEVMEETGLHVSGIIHPLPIEDVSESDNQEFLPVLDICLGT